MINFLKRLDYADEICLLSYQTLEFDQMALNLERKATRGKLKLNSKNTKILSLAVHYALCIYINGQKIESDDKFFYLVALFLPMVAPALMFPKE